MERLIIKLDLKILHFLHIPKYKYNSHDSKISARMDISIISKKEKENALEKKSSLHF